MKKNPKSHTSSPAGRARISVAMATYNGAKYIREQLDSIARQDLLPMELVVTDDGSTDATLEIVDDFGRRAPFAVRVFRNESRLGYADNFLKAASLCGGDLIAFCDQDDVWMEQKLRVCAQFFHDPEVLLLAHSAKILLASGQSGRLFPQFSKTKILSQGASNPFSFVYGFAIVFRKEIVKFAPTTPRPNRLQGHDQWVWFLAASTGRIATIAEALTLYRQHDQNAFGAPSRRSFTERARVFARTLDYSKTAELELDCARILREAAKPNSTYSHRLEISARRFELRSRLHSIRNRMYEPESKLAERAAAFAQIVLLAGYLPRRSKTRLGIRDAIKDLILGVFGGYRFFTAKTGPRNARAI